MSKGHDAVSQMGYIKQALSQNRKSIGFFIGAGCPLAIRVLSKNEEGEDQNDPLIPDVAALTEIVASRFEGGSEEQKASWAKLMKICAEDNLNHQNIEVVLTEVRALGMVAGNGNVRGFTLKELENLDTEICKVILHAVDKSLPDIKSIYHNLAFWVREISRTKPVHIFTTNYDLLIEQALEESAAPYFDGFVGSRKAFFDLGAVENEDLLPARWTRLWKMHGSINWRLDSDRKVYRTDRKVAADSYLIYPSHLKYGQSRKMPYLAMSDRLKEFLLKPSSALFICGYSFGDEHINDVLCRSLESNPSAMAFAFLHGPLNEKYALAKECAMSTPNLSLFAKDRGIVGRTEEIWSYLDGRDSHLPVGLIEPIVPAEDEEISSCNLHIGDFKTFSELLKSISGRIDDDE